MDALAVILLSFSLVNGFDFQKRCLFFNNTCVFFCPRLMHPYHTRCDKDTMSQRTCYSLYTYPIGYTCGWSRCDCDGDLVLDEMTHHCIMPDLCPDPSYKDPNRKSRSRKRGKIPKRIVDDDDEK